MSVTLMYFVHSTSTDNEISVSSGWSNPDLSENGERQARALREIIRDEKFDAVFASDLHRAHKTAHIVFDGHAHVFVDPRLRECNYGEYNGKPSEIVEPMQHHHTHKPFPQGESYEDVKNRMHDFLEMLKHKYEGKRVAIVAHKGPQLALDVLLKNMTWKEAFNKDWRKTGAWQSGWEYLLP